jgi:outer membrane protein
MTFHRFLRGASALVFLPLLLVPAKAQPLPELWQRALDSDPAVVAAAAQWRAAEERLVQARAAYGPTVALTGSHNNNRVEEPPDSQTRPFHARQLVLQLNQPLLRPALGAGRDSAHRQAQQALAQLEQARQESGQRLAEACFDLLKARDALSLLQAQRAVTAEQLAAAQRKYRIGSAPVTDLREAEAKADVVAAQLAGAEQELQLRLQLLAELTGMQAQDLLGRGLEQGALPSLPADALALWLQDALDRSPQVRQAQRAVEVAAAEVDKARAAHAPTLDLTASQTASRDTGTVLTAQGRRYNASQVGVSLNVPLFASGATQSRVREALALQDKAQGELDAARRTVSISVRQQYAAILSALAQARGFTTAVRSGEVALQANRRGYEVGLRVMAELLDAQSKLFDARRELSRSSYDAWLGLARLQALAGRLDAPAFQQLDRQLVTESPAAQVPQRERAR